MTPADDRPPWRTRLIEENLRLVPHIVHHMSIPDTCRLDLEDL